VTRGVAAGLYWGGEGEEAIASQGNGKKKEEETVCVCAPSVCQTSKREEARAFPKVCPVHVCGVRACMSMCVGVSVFEQQQEKNDFEKEGQT